MNTKLTPCLVRCQCRYQGVFFLYCLAKRVQFNSRVLLTWGDQMRIVSGWSLKGSSNVGTTSNEADIRWLISLSLLFFISTILALKNPIPPSFELSSNLVSIFFLPASSDRLLNTLKLYWSFAVSLQVSLHCTKRPENIPGLVHSEIKIRKVIAVEKKPRDRLRQWFSPFYEQKLVDLK